MKIAIIGYSGCGKSTLAHDIAEHFQVNVLHLDSVHFLPNWNERETNDEQQIVNDFMNNHENWVIDGNYSKLSYERRMKEADQIIMLLFNRFNCLYRVTRRYHKYKHTTRPDMAAGCNEKLDKEFITWVLWNGRKKKARSRYKKLQQQYPEKVIIIKNQKQLDKFRRNTLKK